MRSARGVALGALLWSFAAAALAAAGFTVPPTPTHYVTDVAGTLDADTTKALEDKLGSFERSTGHQVIVYIAQTTGGVPLETWTAETAHTWKIGRKGKDDGAVLFLFMKDHKVRIEVGYGLEGTLTDAAASQIINDQIVPRMKRGAPDDAVTAGVDGMLAAIDPSFATAEPTEESAGAATGDEGPPWFVLAFVALVILMVVGPIVLSIAASIKYGLLFAREGKDAASRDMRKSWLHGFMGSGGGSSSGFSSSSDDSSGGGFDAGGGDFGGGGASGSW